MTTQEFLADEIFNELDRIGVSTNQQEYSGLMCDYQSVMIEGSPDAVVVKIYDDHADAMYDGRKLLEFVKTLDSASLEPNAPKNIWNLIREFEV